MNAKYELHRSDKTNSSHYYSWFITRSDDHLPVFSPNQSGDEGMQACMTWLKNKGVKPLGQSYPECNLFG